MINFLKVWPHDEILRSTDLNPRTARYRAWRPVLVSRGEVLRPAGRADPAEGAEAERENVAHDVLDIAGVPAHGFFF
jgi:hypothetical protein